MTFIHTPVDIGYEDLTATTLPAGRTYATPDGKRYPSITTVLSILSKKDIDAWRKRVGEEEANKVSFRASNRGTKVHLIIEKYLNNDPDYAIGFMPNVIESFASVKPTLDTRVGRIYGQETALYSHHLGVAGRVDLVADFDDKISIVDFKTSKKMKRKSYIEQYFMQKTAYAIMWEERTGIPITQLVTLIAVDPGLYQVFIEHRDNWVKPLRDTIKRFHSEISL